MHSAAFQDIVRVLTQGQTPRVWSLLISVFGDLAQTEGAQISGPFLRQLTKTIGIKPEAMRVALHRLRKEGWIESRRQGRSSVYFLTAWGRAQTVAASPRIYASGPAAHAAWLILFNPADPTPNDAESGAWVSANTLITSQVPNHSPAYVSPLPTGTVLPDWMTEKLCSAATLSLAQNFAQALGQVRDQLPDVLSPLETVVLRVLVVHGWRRIVLKTPVLPDRVFPAQWCGPHCRAHVTTLLARYPQPSLDALEATFSPGQPPQATATPATTTEQS